MRRTIARRARPLINWTLIGGLVMDHSQRQTIFKNKLTINQRGVFWPSRGTKYQQSQTLDRNLQYSRQRGFAEEANYYTPLSNLSIKGEFHKK